MAKLVVRFPKSSAFETDLLINKASEKHIADLRAQEDWITGTHAMRAIETVTMAVQALSRADPSVDVDWLIESERDPYA